MFAEPQRDDPRRHITVDIVDDVSHTSIRYEAEVDIRRPLLHAVFYGLGGDGTNKITAKIVGDETALEVQGDFVYDSKKSGAMTVSNLRFDTADHIDLPRRLRRL